MTRETRTLLLAGGVLAVLQAAVLASVFTPAPHTGGDNAGYLSLGYAIAQGLGYVELWEPGAPLHTKYPPILPLVLAGLTLLGATTWTAFKAVPLLFTSLALILVFVWAGGRKGGPAGLAVAAITLLSVGWLDASRWILSEPLFLAFTFLAFWAADQGGVVLDRGRGDRSPGGTDDASSQALWMGVAGAAALLALLTRSAGLPLVLALAGALLLIRRRRAVVAFAGAALLVGGAWGWRARFGGEGAYQSEFWMVNPYQPELGTVGALGLLGRVWTNLRLYAGSVLPGEWWPGVGLHLLVLGLALTGLALAGWGLRLRRGRVGVPELFLPIYTGLILLWPEVWSGSRFALPLYPLLLLYAGEALTWTLRRMGRPGWGTAAVASGVLLLAVPAVPTWLDLAGEAGECRSLAERDVFGCLPPGVRGFRDAAVWSGEHLPEGVWVMNRKPRLFHLLGGGPGKVFPFTRDPELLLEEADRLGTRHLLVGWPDGVMRNSVPHAVRARPGAFCVVQEWGPETLLLEILPPEERDAPELEWCESPPPPPPPPVAGGREIPLLSPPDRR